MKHNRQFAIKLIYFSTILFAVNLFFCKLSSPGNWFFNILFSLTLTALFAGSFLVCFKNDQKNPNEWILGNLDNLFLILFGILIFIPVYCTGYYFHDDFWGFPSYNLNSQYGGITFGRIYQGLVPSFFPITNSANIGTIRGIQVVFALILSLLIKSWFYTKTGDKVFSVALAIILTFSSLMVDCVAYASLVTFTLSLALSALFVFTVEKSCDEYSSSKFYRGLVFQFISIFLFFSALHSYQLALNFVFFMLAVKVYFKPPSQKIYFFVTILGLTLIIACVIYIVSNNYFADLYGHKLNSRGQFIHSYSEIIQKIVWFFQIVIPASFDRLIAVFSGSLFFQTKNLWYFLEYNTAFKLYSAMIKLFIGFFILISFINFFKKNRNAFDFVVLFLTLPGCYIVHLLLIENAYLSHYAFSFISVLVFLFINGLILFSKKIFRSFGYLKGENVTIYVLFAASFIVVFQSILYQTKFWAIENTITYSFIKNNVYSAIKNGVSRIHVYGVPNHPGQANVYSKFATNLALREFGIDPNSFTITVSDTQDYINTLEKNDFETALQSLSADEKAEISDFYFFAPTYSQYHLKTTSLTNQSMNRLRYLSNKALLIPPNADNILFIDLSWKSSVW